MADSASRGMHRAARDTRMPQSARRLSNIFPDEAGPSLIRDTKRSRRELPARLPEEAPSVRSTEVHGSTPSDLPNCSSTGVSVPLVSSKSARRSSFNLKNTRRISSLRDGAPAYPHADIPDDVLYRHCSDLQPPVVRMKFLLMWALYRSMEQARGESKMPHLSKRALGKTKASSVLSLFSPPPERTSTFLSDKDEQLFAEISPRVQSIMDNTLKALNSGLLSISWLHQSHERPDVYLQPNPRNDSNKHAEMQLNGMLQQLYSELDAWRTQEEAIKRMDTETEAIEALVEQIRQDSAYQRKEKSIYEGDGADLDEEQAIADEVFRAINQGADGKNASETSPNVFNEVPSWSADDLDEAGLEQLKYAERTIASTISMNEAVENDVFSDIVDSQGTEMDSALDRMEFKVRNYVPFTKVQTDLLYARLHTLQQLDYLAQEYVKRVSKRAAQALQERMSTGLATYAGSAAEGPESASAQQRTDSLLTGVWHDDEAASAPSRSSNDIRLLLRGILKSSSST